METIVVAPATTFTPAYIVAESYVFGDSSGTIVGKAQAQNFGFVFERSEIFGDADIIIGTGRGGNDVFRLAGTQVYHGGSSSGLYGDARKLTDHARGGDDHITTRGGADGIFVVGDADEMDDNARGGDDRIEGDSQSSASGDAVWMKGSAVGGRDVLRVAQLGIGDGDIMYDRTRGGDDVIYGRLSEASLFGDAFHMESDSQGGDDTVYANGANSTLYGDASYLGNRAKGGDDYLHSKAGGARLIGDGDMEADAKGGNDVLSGSAGRDTLIGDGWWMFRRTYGGNDVLLGGKGNDLLYGDAIHFDSTGERGADRFVFAGASGKDTIGDFQRGKDVIDVTALGYTSFGQLDIDESGGNSVVHFLGSNQVKAVGVTGLTASDFLFA